MSRPSFAETLQQAHFRRKLRGAENRHDISAVLGRGRLDSRIRRPIVARVPTSPYRREPSRSLAGTRANHTRQSTKTFLDHLHSSSEFYREHNPSARRHHEVPVFEKPNERSIWEIDNVWTHHDNAGEEAEEKWRVDLLTQMKRRKHQAQEGELDSDFSKWHVSVHIEADYKEHAAKYDAEQKKLKEAAQSRAFMRAQRMTELKGAREEMVFMYKKEQRHKAHKEAEKMKDMAANRYQDMEREEYGIHWGDKKVLLMDTTKTRFVGHERDRLLARSRKMQPHRPNNRNAPQLAARRVAWDSYFPS